MSISVAAWVVEKDYTSQQTWIGKSLNIANSTIRVARGLGGHSPRFVEHGVILCFEGRYLKQNSVIRLISNILSTLHILDWYTIEYYNNCFTLGGIILMCALRLSKQFTSQVSTRWKLGLMRSEIPSGMCAKLRTAAASNNKDHARNLSY